ncbi:MAG TPA: hypothetical protein VF502_08445 [Stellaceae bacterium]
MKRLVIALGLIFAVASPAYADQDCADTVYYLSAQARQAAALQQSQIERLQAENAFLRQQLVQKSTAGEPPPGMDDASTPTTVRGNVPKHAPPWPWPFEAQR